MPRHCFMLTATLALDARAMLLFLDDKTFYQLVLLFQVFFFIFVASLVVPLPASGEVDGKGKNLIERNLM